MMKSVKIVFFIALVLILVASAISSTVTATLYPITNQSENIVTITHTSTTADFKNEVDWDNFTNNHQEEAQVTFYIKKGYATVCTNYFGYDEGSRTQMNYDVPAFDDSDPPVSTSCEQLLSHFHENIDTGSVFVSTGWE